MNSKIRKATESDKIAVWGIIKPVIEKGDTYMFAPDSPKDKMLNYWFAEENHVYVAMIDDLIVGTYLLKNNQPDLGSHVANGSYMVHPDHNGKGLGRLMGEHSLNEARTLGYHAIQFNCVIMSNTSAIVLWKKLGFKIIGEIPDAYQHATLGLTNAYIMYQKL